MMEQKQWRQTVDPYSLDLHERRIIEVLDYPHAGNDVFHVALDHGGARERAYLKVERQRGADVENEITTLSALGEYAMIHAGAQWLKRILPQPLYCSLGEPRFLLTREAEGRRLSALLGDNRDMASLEYLPEYGATLARFHRLDIRRPKVRHRRQFEIPDHGYFVRKDAEAMEGWLRSHQAEGQSDCFIHGDFHYANVLWLEDGISCVLDYELSGTGIREWDIAWAVFLRPGQLFLNTVEEQEAFLTGYSEMEDFSLTAYRYYLMLIACHFLPVPGADEEYRRRVFQLTRDLGML